LFDVLPKDADGRAAAGSSAQPLFLCQSCGYPANADDVSSMNILSRGIEALRDEGQDTAHACARVGDHRPDLV
jgi:transposase